MASIKDEILILSRAADMYLKDYCFLAERIAERIADVISKATGLKVEWSLGWEEGGVDAICFFIKEREKWDWEEVKAGKLKWLFLVLYEIFPELKGLHFYFDTPFGVWLTEEEIEKIRRAFLEEEKLEEV